MLKNSDRNGVPAANQGPERVLQPGAEDADGPRHFRGQEVRTPPWIC